MIGLAENQIYSFLMCFAVGCLLGILYCFFSPIRRRMKHKAWVIMLDLIFWLFATASFMLTLYLATAGKLRMFCFLALLLGCLAAIYGPGHWLIKWETAFLPRFAQKRKALLARMEENRKQ